MKHKYDLSYNEDYRRRENDQETFLIIPSNNCGYGYPCYSSDYVILNDGNQNREYEF